MKNNFTAGLMVGANLLLAIFLIMGVSSTSSNELKTTSEAALGNEPFIGEISMFAGNFAPRGWAFCDGQLLSISENTALFSLLGTTYGGDGRTTFALPDLRGRVSVHPGSGAGLSTYRLGQKGGVESATMTAENMPSHNHTIAAYGKNPNTNDPNGAVMANLGPVPSIYSNKIGKVQMNPTGYSGGEKPFDIRQPFLGVNYIIALQGIYPSRS